MKLMILGIGFLVLSTQVQAQTVSSYVLQVYAQGVDATKGTPFQTSPIPMSFVTCGFPISPVPTGSVTNPRFLVFQDGGNPGKECKVDRSAFLLALPAGSGYTATITAIGPDGTSSERSNVSNPFALAPVGKPAALLGLGVRP